ncbi:MAG: hypothetical protein ACE5R6_17100 [Candidatus Heimdallarchaeota archaeon]
MSFNSNSLLQYAIIFFLIGTIIQILAWRKAKTIEREERKQIQSFLSKGDPVDLARSTNDPLVFEKVDEQTFRKIDKIMKDGY